MTTNEPELDPNQEELRKIRLEKANSWLSSEVKRLEKESRKLHRMIEEGITFEDLENDITFPG